MLQFFKDIIERYSKYDMNVAVVINDVVNSMSGR